MIAGLTVLLFGAHPVLSAQALPERLSDAAFWQMVTDLSEEGGTFSSENFLSNERNFQYVISRLEAETTTGVYLGVGPEQNFTYIAALHPGMAFIIDIRRQNMMQHLLYKAAFELAANRAEFLSILFSRALPESLSKDPSAGELFAAFGAAPHNDQLAARNLEAIRSLLVGKHGFALSKDDLDTIEYVHLVFSLHGPGISYSSTVGNVGAARSRGNPNYTGLMTATDEEGVNRSYLATEENFLFVKDMEARNLIVPVVGDFGGPKALRAVGRYIRERGSSVSAFYLSNVEQYLFQPMGRNVFNGGAQAFYNNAATLPMEDSSMFIRSGSNVGASQPYEGFESLLSPMAETIEAVQDGRIQSHRQLLEFSK